MATSFKKTFVKPVPRLGEKITTDTIYWKNLEAPVTKKEYCSITNIDFSPVAPHQFAVTNSTRVQIYNSASLQIHKTISKFKEVAYSGSFRDDGKLLIAGGDEGVIRLFDVEGKSLLRMFKGHKGSVHVSKFLASRTQLFSGSDDNTMCVWDIPSETEVVTYAEHKDYVRCGVAGQASKDIILTGSYDHTVKMFDTRIGESIMTVEHGAPVESVLMFPTGGIFVSAGGNVVKVWDALAGGKLITTLAHHHKTVMCLCFCSNYQRLMSGGLDRHVKIYDVGTYQVVHTLDYPGAILSVAVSPDDNLLAVGTVEGLLSLQRRKPDVEPVKKRKKPVSYRYGLRGKTYVPNKDDHYVEHRRKEQLARYDRFFKRFEYSKALDAALDPKLRKRSPEITVSVMQELIRRGGIKAAVAGREGNSLQRLLKFIQKNLSNPRFMSNLIDVATLVVDLYSQQLGQSSEVDRLLVLLKTTVDQEIDYMKMLFQVMGSLDTLFASSQHAHLTSQNSQTVSHDPVLEPSEAAQDS